jgi:hypothetical protein
VELVQADMAARHPKLDAEAAKALAWYWGYCAEVAAYLADQIAARQRATALADAAIAWQPTPHDRRLLSGRGSRAGRTGRRS